MTVHTPWDDRMAAADDEAARRRLLAEVGGWRARQLGDVLALRQAAWAMARLYALLGDNVSAVREAESLVRLCQTHPPAGEQELGEARALARTLGGTGGVRARGANKPKKNARKAPKKGGEAPRPSALAAARDAYAAGDLDAARKLLRKKRGSDAVLLRAAVWVDEIRASPEEAREAGLDRLAAWLRRQVGAAQSKPRAAAPSAEPATVDASPLAALLGGRVPTKRRAHIHALHKAASEHPDKRGDLAVAALQHHVSAEGLTAPAPWLVGVVARAVLSGQGDGPMGAIASLRDSGAVCADAYSEWAWTAALDAAGAIEGDFDELRRGVLARGGEPDDRKIWTLRITGPKGKAMVAFANPEDAPYPAEYATKVAERVRGLAEGALLVAPGEGNAPLRDAAAKVGLSATDAREPSAWAEAVVWHGERAAPTPTKEKESRPSKERAQAGLLAALNAEPLDVGAIREALGAFERLHKAFVAIRGAELSDEAQLAFLEAAHASAPDKARLPEGTSIAVRLAAGGNQAARGLLTEGETAERFGGPGVERILEASTALVAGGVDLDRAVRGAMARERRQDPVLSALGEAQDAVWRLMGRRGEEQVQLLVLGEDTPEGRAAVPRLWERAGAMLLPEEAAEWAASLDGPPVHTAVDAAVGALTGA